MQDYSSYGHLIVIDSIFADSFFRLNRMSQELNDQELERREGLKQLRELGIDPYPAALFPVDTNAVEIKEKIL